MVPRSWSFGSAGAWLWLSLGLYAGPNLATAEAIKIRMMPIFQVLDNRYGFDNFFYGLARMGDKLAEVSFWFDDRIVDGIFVDGWALVMLLLAEFYNFIDTVIVDGIVDLFGTVSTFFGRFLRSFIRGQVQEYLLFVAFAMLLFFAGHWMTSNFQWSDLFWWN